MYCEKQDSKDELILIPKWLNHIYLRISMGLLLRGQCFHGFQSAEIRIWLRWKGQVKTSVLWKRLGLKIRQITKQAGQSRDPAELTRSVGSTANHCWRLWEFLCEGGARAGQSTPAVTGVDWDIVFLRNLLNDNQLDLLRKVISQGTSLEVFLGILTKFIQWRNLHLYLMQKLYNL